MFGNKKKTEIWEPRFTLEGNHTHRVPEWKKDYLKFKACKPDGSEACL